MVDWDKVEERLLRGAYVGAGSFGSGMLAGVMEENTPLGDIGTSLGQIGVGAGVSVGADYVFDPNQDEMFNDAMEFAGYGIEGAGFSNLGSAVGGMVQTGAASGAKVVEVSTNAGAQTGQQAEEVQQEEEFSLDV